MVLVLVTVSGLVLVLELVFVLMFVFVLVTVSGLVVVLVSMFVLMFVFVYVWVDVCVRVGTLTVQSSPVTVY